MSAVWNYFMISKDDSRVSVCNKCSSEVQRGGNKAKSFNTTNLISHLKSGHSQYVFKEYEAATMTKKTKPAGGIATARINARDLLTASRGYMLLNIDFCINQDNGL